MESDEADYSGVKSLVDDVNDRYAVNSTVLDYYKKFGRKRDLEQFFSLSTAQSEIRDPTSLFWRRMKAQNDSSDSGGKRSESPTELCRISIRCSIPDPDPSSSQDDNQDENTKPKCDSESPPIITEEGPVDTSRNTDDDDESIKSDDNHSQKSIDIMLDTSMNKPFSPTSSITSQRKLEWDSLADVGYANESDKKTSASSLSTLERLALAQQYSNNDTKQDANIGTPTAHSTPFDENDSKAKVKKGSKTTKIYRRDIDCVEVNVPHSSEANPQAINVNLTKHISFNVEKDGAVKVENLKGFTSRPESVSVQTDMTPQIRMDKEIQTTLCKPQDKSSNSIDLPQMYAPGIPVLINLNTLRRRTRRKKIKSIKRKLRSRKKLEADKENVPVQEKSGEQVSEAESFEYMPGHMYNQNQMNQDQPQPPNTAGNKSSLESSGILTTDSSKGSKHSFSKDLEKSINLLKVALRKRCNDAELKQNLVKEVVQRLLQSTYRDDESTTDFLSGLSFNSKKLGLREENTTTTSTSDTTNTAEKVKLQRPKKSILRVDKFNPSVLASTSQSAPNLPSVTNNEKLVTTNLTKPLLTSNTESDMSSKEKNSSDTAFAKTSSEELYQKYLDALRREQSYKKHLRDKELFLKQKLVSSGTAFNMPVCLDTKSQNRLKELMKDLTRNNYDDGSGDASKLEGGPNYNSDLRYVGRKHRSHSVFTLSSGNSTSPNRKSNLKKTDNKDPAKAGNSKDDYHYCCCPYHSPNTPHSENTKTGVTDSCVQVNIKKDDERQIIDKQNICVAKSPRTITRVVSDNATGDLKYVCMCNNDVVCPDFATDNLLIYKCSRLANTGIQSQEIPNTSCVCKNHATTSKCSQTNLATKLCKNNRAVSTICINCNSNFIGENCHCCSNKQSDEFKYVHEATRCLQTEISINPRIADPSLCDIKIMSDLDCAELIGEQYRQVSKSSIESDDKSYPQKNVARAGSEHSQKSTKSCINKSLNKNVNKKYKETQSDTEQTKGNRLESTNVGQKTVKDNFTVPIQGTNMALKVSTGSNTITVPMGEVSVGTSKAVKINAAADATAMENGTSPSMDYSKVVPSQNLVVSSKESQREDDSNFVNTIFAREIYSNELHQEEVVDPSPAPYVHSNSTEAEDLEKGVGVRNELLDDFFATQQQIEMAGTIKDTYNTYPKVQSNELKRLFRRTLTDTGNIQTGLAKIKEQIESHDSSPSAVRHIQKITDEKESSKKPFVFTDNVKGKSQKESSTEGASLTESFKTETTDNKKPKISFRSGTDSGQIKNRSVTKSNDKPKPLLRSNTDDGKYLYTVAPEIHTLTNKSNPFRYSDIDNKTSNICNSQATTSKMYGTKAVGHSLKSGTESENEPEVKAIDSKSKPLVLSDIDSYVMDKNVKDKDSNFEDMTINERKKSVKKCDCGCSDSACEGDCNPLECNVNSNTDTSDNLFNINTNTPKLRSSTDSDRLEKNSSTEETESQKNNVLKTCECGCSDSECHGKCNASDCNKHKIILGDINESETKSTDKKPLMISRAVADTNKLPKCDCGCADPSKCKGKCESNVQTRRGMQTDYVASMSQQTQKHEPMFPQKGMKGDGNSSEPRTSSDEQSKNNSTSKDLIMEMIQDITKRYSKGDIERNQRKKCFKEIMTILNYLLDTDDSTDPEVVKSNDCCTSDDKNNKKSKDILGCCGDKKPPGKEIKTVSSSTTPESDFECCKKKEFVNKAVQLEPMRSRSCRAVNTESSDPPHSTDMPCTSSDSATCKVLNKIRKECEKYQKRCCKSHQHSGKRCDGSSSTSLSCDQCRRIHHCSCRTHKCKSHKSKCMEKKKKSVAYNLIIQTSESMMSEEATYENCCRPLQSIVVKVPPKRKVENVPFKEMVTKIEKKQRCCSPHFESRSHRSRSLPNESGFSSNEDCRGNKVYTVKDYLEKNRPDFVEQASHRQNCMKIINERRFHERESQRELLLLQQQLQMGDKSALNALSESDLRRLARDIGLDFRRQKVPPNYISEHDMKKHSEKIYKTLPEQLEKKEKLKKESIKKTNLLMANLFKKNLQKKTLRGSVNLSNYCSVVRI